MYSGKGICVMLYVLCLIIEVKRSNGTRIGDYYNQTQELENNHNIQNEVLSRRKRFIIFDEGSSIQLVFCLTYPTIFEIGDIFLWGYTAALAYELPQDPYSPFMHHADPLHRRADTKTVYYTDYDGKVLFKSPYKKKPLVNPAFAKRSADLPLGANQFKAETFKIDKRQMHASKHKRRFLKSEHMEERSVEFHRSSRATLYRKIETLLQAVGRNGRDCVLKTLCLVGQSQDNTQGSFFEEILRAVFTLPKGRATDILEEYDAAIGTKEDCNMLYPDCEDSLMETTTSTINK